MPVLDTLKCEKCDVTFTIPRDAPGAACPTCATRYKIDRQSETRIALAMTKLEEPSNG